MFLMSQRNVTDTEESFFLTEPFSPIAGRDWGVLMQIV